MIVNSFKLPLQTVASSFVIGWSKFESVIRESLFPSVINRFVNSVWNSGVFNNIVEDCSKTNSSILIIFKSLSWHLQFIGRFFLNRTLILIPEG